ncbi:MAG TPA: hypothetical protein VGP72_14655 [Planctomycetota bacterium]|jgi:hypothetical protein
MTSADRFVELFQDEMHDALQFALQDARQSKDAREAVRRLGGYLRDDGMWRGMIKRAAGWNGGEDAWATLARFIAKNDDGRPWWQILNYADGRSVSEDVKAFFEGAV